MTTCARPSRLLATTCDKNLSQALSSACMPAHPVAAARHRHTPQVTCAVSGRSKRTTSWQLRTSMPSSATARQTGRQRVVIAWAGIAYKGSGRGMEFSKGHGGRRHSQLQHRLACCGHEQVEVAGSEAAQDARLLLQHAEHGCVGRQGEENFGMHEATNGALASIAACVQSLPGSQTRRPPRAAPAP